MPKRTLWPLRGPSRATYHFPFACGALILVIGLLSSWLLAAQSADRAVTTQTRLVRVHLDRLSGSIPQVLQSYEKGLRGVRGALLVGGPQILSADAFAAYVRSLDTDTEFPGAREFGFMGRRPDSAGFVGLGATARTFAMNDRVRESADRAMRSGRATLTAPVAGRGGAGEGGNADTLLLLLPVYGLAAHIGPGSTEAAREAATLGWAYVALDVDRVIGRLDIDRQSFTVQIRDTTDAPQAAPFLASGPFRPQMPSDLTMVDAVSFFGRTWSVALQPSPAFLAGLHLAPSGLKALLGSLASVLAGSLVVAALALRARRLDLFLRAREQFRLALEASPTGMLAMNAAGRITFINRQIEKLFGYARTELVGQPIEVLIPQRLRAEFTRWFTTLLRQGARQDAESGRDLAGLHRSGREIPIEVGVSPLETSEGAVVLCAISDITERRAAAEQLRALNAQLAAQVTQRSGELRSVQRGLATILDALPSMIGYWDRELVNRMTNRAYRELFASQAADREEVTVRDLDPLIAQRSIEVAAVLRGERVSYEHSLEERDGAPGRYLLVHLIPDSLDGEIPGFYVLAHDVTELTHSKLKLAAVIRENDGLLSTLHQHALVSVADRAGRIVDVNAAFCAISGYDRDELLGRDHRIVSSGLHPPEFWSEMWQQLRQGKPWRAEVCNRAKDGSLYWVDSIITPFFGADGGIAKYISIRFNITAHKEAQRRLLESERFLQRVEKVSGVGGFMIDLKSDEQRWTRQSYAIFEVEEGQPPSRELVASFLNPEVSEQLATATRRACESGDGYDIEMPIVTAAGRSIWIRAVGEIERAEGVPLRIVGAVEDITKRRAMEDRLREAIAVAERASKAKSEFLANMSHEIRTPLNAVIGLGYLLEQTLLSEDQHQLLNKIQFSGRALLSVVNNVLDLSKIEADEVSLENAPFDLAELVRDVCQMLGPQANLKGIELDAWIAPTSPRWVRGDSLRLRQVLTNLLNNGIKFTESGSVRLELGPTELEAGRLRLRCVVRDTGIGIEPAALKLLFTPFTQADASTTRRFGGTGLGLSIARRLVNLMGGEIGVESAVGVGSTFWIELPLEIVDELREAAPAADAQRIRVLILDLRGDAPDGFGAMVRALGWRATVETCAKHLVDGLSETAVDAWPDVLLIDPPAGDFEPRDLRARLAALRADRDLPPVLWVADVAEALAQAGLADEASDPVLLRPVTSSALFNAINSALWRRNEGRERLLQSTNIQELQTQWLAGVRVLVVDDSDINLEVARRILEEQGALVTCCADGNAGVEYVRSHHPAVDVVLMDIQMPFLDGNAATRSIRRALGLSRLPIVALTAGALVGERQRSLEAGVNDFISKPFDPLTLIRTTRRLVEQVRGSPIPVVGRETSPGTSMVGGTPMNSIDPVVVQQMFGEDLYLFRSLLARLLRDYSDLAIPPLEHLDQQPVRTALAARTHKLKGSAGMIGASRVMRLAGSVEAALLAHRGAETVERLLRDLAESLTTLREEGERFLEAHPPGEPTDEAAPRPDTERQADFEELHELLDRQDLSAIDRFRTLSGELHAALPAGDLDRLRAAIENLDFQQGAELLRRSGVHRACPEDTGGYVVESAASA